MNRKRQAELLEYFEKGGDPSEELELDADALFAEVDADLLKKECSK